MIVMQVWSAPVPGQEAESFPCSCESGAPSLKSLSVLLTLLACSALCLSSPVMRTGYR